MYNNGVRYCYALSIINESDSFFHAVYPVLKLYILFNFITQVTMSTPNPSRHRRRKGLSIVVTTLIILTFSVLLALTAINYTNGLTRSRMKSTGQEDIRFYKKHAWVRAFSNGTDRAVVAFKIHNLGGKSISAQVIDIRGSEIDWPDVYYHKVNKTSEATLLWSDIPEFEWASLTGSSVMIGGYNYNQSMGPVFVDAGQTLVVYIKAPEIIFKDNIGMPMVIGVGTTQASYFTELVIEAAS